MRGLRKAQSNARRDASRQRREKAGSMVFQMREDRAATADRSRVDAVPFPIAHRLTVSDRGMVFEGQVRPATLKKTPPSTSCIRRSHSTSQRASSRMSGTRFPDSGIPRLPSGKAPVARMCARRRLAAATAPFTAYFP